MSSTRKLVAALACRVQGSRLYGKPLQNLKANKTILDHILDCFEATPEIEDVVLGISEGVENLPFIDLAHRRNVSYIIGDQKDVLWRLIQCGRAGAASDVFRITSECPFTAWEFLPDLWRDHVAHGYDITVVDRLPEGMHFEIYTLAALERIHSEGKDEHRSEYVSAYPRFNQDRFKIGIKLPSEKLQRLDLRLTVDYPEDLVICRKVYLALLDKNPRISTDAIIDYLDRNDGLKKLVSEFVVPEPVWYGVTGPAGQDQS